MKRIIFALILALLCVGVTACRKKANGETESQEIIVSWKEQYDLGIRLLAEGKYEEAVLVFEAMIQIDPKQSEVYQELANVYVSMGDYEKAISVLTEGYTITGVELLQQQLSEVQQKILEMQSQKGSPSQAPEVPGVLVGRYLGVITYESFKYVSFTEDEYALLVPFVEAGLQGNLDVLLANAEHMNSDMLLDFSVEWDEEIISKHYVGGWTMWDGNLIGYHLGANNNYWNFSIEYRPAEGEGFYFNYTNQYRMGISYTLLQGHISNHLFHGEYIVNHNEYGNIQETYGTAKAELIHGEYTTVHSKSDDHFYFDGSVTTYNLMLADGKLQCAWMDPDTGEEAVIYYVIEYADGSTEEHYVAASAYSFLIDDIFYVTEGTDTEAH